MARPKHLESRIGTFTHGDFSRRIRLSTAIRSELALLRKKAKRLRRAITNLKSERNTQFIKLFCTICGQAIPYSGQKRSKWAKAKKCQSCQNKRAGNTKFCQRCGSEFGFQQYCSSANERATKQQKQYRRDIQRTFEATRHLSLNQLAGYLVEEQLEHLLIGRSIAELQNEFRTCQTAEEATERLGGRRPIMTNWTQGWKGASLCPKCIKESSYLRIKAAVSKETFPINPKLEDIKQELLKTNQQIRELTKRA